MSRSRSKSTRGLSPQPAAPCSEAVADHRSPPLPALLVAGVAHCLAVLAGLSLANSPAHAALPGLNGRIACDGERGTAPGGPAPGFPEFVTPRAELYTMNADGSGFVRLTDNAVSDIDPSFSPDGSKLAFSSTRTSSFQSAHTMNANGTNVQRLIFTSGSSFATSWSPSGASIAFMDGTMGFNIARVNADTSGYRRLTTNPAIDGLPSWSPDGTRIAFDSTRSGMFQFQVYTMSAEEGEATGVNQLTMSPNSYSPHWAPDGSRLAFLSDRDDNTELYSMRADGSDQRRLTTNTVDNPATTQIDESDDRDVAYSPDGTKIVFSSARSGDYEVYTANADGSGVTRLTNSPGFDGRCDWQPVRPAVAPVYPPISTTPITPPRGKHRTSLTLRAKPRRDRRPPFRFTLSGRVRIPGGVSAAAVCGGRVRLVLRKGRRTVARGTARVTRRCTYRKRITIRGTRRTGRERARLRVTARYGGNASLSSAPRRSTTVRIF